VMGLQTPLFHWSSIGWVPEVWLANHHVDAVTGKDLVLILGGAFLIAKSVLEIHKKTAGEDEEAPLAARAQGASFASVIAQIVALDLVFSLDSVISAIGMVKEVWIMVVAMLVAVAFMAAFAGRISAFIEKNPTFKMLALAFLVLIGVVLVADGFGQEMNKGYIYASMVFALAVEVLNLRARRRRKARQAAAA
jgi:predicted tellurium resistance membrane protein TerC